jgi:hypothetical protein
VDVGLQVGAPTDGNKGTGTVNVSSGYYINGVSIQAVPTVGTFALGVYKQGVAADEAALEFNSGILQNCTITQIVWTFYVSGTNDASNYWNLRFKRQSDTSFIGGITTAAYAGSTWIRVVQTTSLALTTDDIAIYLYLNKTNSPGNLYIYPPIITAV